MTTSRLLSLTLVGLLLGCQSMAQNSPNTAAAQNTAKPIVAVQPASLAPAQLTLDATPSVQCPPDRPCDAQAVYRALQWQSAGVEVYLSFAGKLAEARDVASLARHFGHADIYLPQPDGKVLAVHAGNDDSAEASLRFLPAPAGRLRAQLVAKRHRLQSDGAQNGAACRTDDMQGICRRETSVTGPWTLDLDLAWPVR
ncbi:hypothetical protein FNU76_03030 [Chitinimonas arctica]|uniref:Lipoprotein n=1 Tax=Chitinimonas arctica TaxID=2594795 RepID=A0A516SB88_9NEIS|nr:hypothetical protein [Chitinimonas arctica]QDQ25410.1 hypothetical protein FNU76_03030 [Chitinimonas arctica]